MISVPAEYNTLDQVSENVESFFDPKIQIQFLHSFFKIPSIRFITLVKSSTLKNFTRLVFKTSPQLKMVVDRLATHYSLGFNGQAPVT